MTERRKDFLDEILKDLDDSCSLILVGIAKNPEGIGFNQLHREIRKHSDYRQIAKSTLSEHLKHLLKKNLIEREEIRESLLKLKPTKYRISSYFKKLSKGFIAQSVTPEDYLPLMMSEEVNTVTQHLMFIIIQHLSDCLKSILQTPENISIWNMHQLFYNMETLMIAYRERILKKNEVNPALKVIHNSTVKAGKSFVDSS